MLLDTIVANNEQLIEVYKELLNHRTNNINILIAFFSFVVVVLTGWQILSFVKVQKELSSYKMLINEQVNKIDAFIKKAEKDISIPDIKVHESIIQNLSFFKVFLLQAKLDKFYPYFCFLKIENHLYLYERHEEKNQLSTIRIELDEILIQLNRLIVLNNKRISMPPGYLVDILEKLPDVFNTEKEKINTLLKEFTLYNPNE